MNKRIEMRNCEKVFVVDCVVVGVEKDNLKTYGSLFIDNPLETSSIIDSGEDLGYGEPPRVASSHKHTPNDHTSDADVNNLSVSTSGAAHYKYHVGDQYKVRLSTRT